MAAIGYVKGMIQKDSNVQLWVNDKVKTYTCPKAQGVLARSVASWCQFTDPTLANKECQENPSCIGVACGIYSVDKKLYCTASKVAFVASKTFISTTYVKGYNTINQNGLSIAETAGQYLCPNAKNVDTKNSTFCSFTTTAAAQAHCTLDSICAGILCINGKCTATTKPLVGAKSSPSTPSKPPADGALYAPPPAVISTKAIATTKPAVKTTLPAYKAPAVVTSKAVATSAPSNITVVVKSSTTFSNYLINSSSSRNFLAMLLGVFLVFVL